MKIHRFFVCFKCTNYFSLKDYQTQLDDKKKILNDYLKTIHQLISIAQGSSERPPVCNDIEIANKLLASIAIKVQ